MALKFRLSLILMTVHALTSAAFAQSISPLPSVIHLRAEQGYSTQYRVAITGTGTVTQISASWSGGSWFYSIVNGTSLPTTLVMSANARSLTAGLYTGYVTVRAGSTATNSPQTVRVDFEVTPPASRSAVSVFRSPLGVVQAAEFGAAAISSSATPGSDPASSQAASGETYVAARSQTNSLIAGVYYPASKSWSSWQNAGGVIQGQPAVAAVSSTQSYVVVKDNYSTYWLVPFSRTAGFGAWTALNGVFATDPTAAACPDGTVYIAGRDNYNAIWAGRYVPGSGFQGWSYGAGVFAGKPSVACGVNDAAAYIAARDNYGAVWMGRFASGAWAWNSGGGVFTSDPKVAVTGLGVVFAVLQDSGGVVWFRPFTEGTGNNWQQWMNSKGIVQAFAPSAIRGLLYIAARDSGNQLLWYRSSTAAWSAAAGITLTGAPASAPY